MPTSADYSNHLPEYFCLDSLVTDGSTGLRASPYSVCPLNERRNAYLSARINATNWSSLAYRDTVDSNKMNILRWALIAAVSNTRTKS